MSVQEKWKDERPQRRKELVSTNYKNWRKEITQFTEKN